MSNQKKLTAGILDLIKQETGEFQKSLKGQAGVKEKQPEKKKGGGLFGKKDTQSLKEQILGKKKEIATKGKDSSFVKSAADQVFGKHDIDPITEAMMQGTSDEELAKAKIRSDRLDPEMAKYRRLRMQQDKDWYELQQELMQKHEEEKQRAPATPPSGPAKGPGAAQRVNQAAGMESFKRGKKN